MENILQKLDNTQTKDRIANILRQEIISGRIKDGEQLAQEQIAQYLDVSRIPVREAFLILELDGFLLRLPTRHVIAVGPNPDMLKDILELVATVEIQIIKNIISTKKEIKNLIYKDEKQFHRLLSKTIDNHYLNLTYSKLLNGYPLYIWDNISNRPDVVTLHTDLIAAIREAEVQKITSIVYQYYLLLAEVLIKEINRS